MPEKLIQDKAKQIAAKAAADWIQEGMTVGIGTGSTIAYFIPLIAKKKITALATSIQTENLAKEQGIVLLDPEQVSELDIAVDGADEIDVKKQMIKGGGGALLREKIVASMAKKMLVIVDETKCVETLGKFPLPVEIACFGCLATFEHLKLAGLVPRMRKFITDNGNYIADLHFSQPITNPAEVDRMLKQIPGVLETGLFINLAKVVIIGHGDEKVTTWE